MPLNYEDVVEIARERLPFAVREDEYMFDELWELPHVVFDDVYTWYTVRTLQRRDEPGAQRELRAIFDFMEQCLAEGDDAVVNLVEVSFVEPLWSDMEDEATVRYVREHLAGPLVNAAIDRETEIRAERVRRWGLG